MPERCFGIRKREEMKVKSIPAKDVEKLINSIEASLKKIDEQKDQTHYYAASVALGMAIATLEITVKQLNGTYGI